MKRSMLGLLVVGLLAGPLAGHSEAATVQGGFTSFSGCVGYNATIRQWLNNVEFVGTGAACDSFTKSANFEFATTSSVEFKNSSLSSSTGPIYNTPNVISFEANTPTVNNLGDEILLGWMTFTNGIWTGDAYFGFTLSIVDAVLGTHTFTDTVVYNLTPNEDFNTRKQNADFLTFSNNPQVGELRAFELSLLGPNTVKAELWGHIGSLHLDRFANPDGGGFVVPGATPAPEPGSLALLLAAGSAMAWSQRRRRSDSVKRAQ